MTTGHQKVDHGGKFSATPHKLIDSVAWRELSGRATKVLMLLQSRHNGFNNGRIAFSIHDLGSALGNQNHKANSRAVAELIELGFIECMSDADRRHSKAREYRITYISAGDKKGDSPATNEYLEWRPAKPKRRKFGGARIATEGGNCQPTSTTRGKFSIADSVTPPAEISRISVGHCVEETAPHIGNQYGVTGKEVGNILLQPPRTAGAPGGVEAAELRRWFVAVLARLGHGGQKRLSDETGVPQPVLCKFKNGRGLPAHYLMGLQTACARVLPFKDWVASEES